MVTIWSGRAIWSKRLAPYLPSARTRTHAASCLICRQLSGLMGTGATRAELNPAVSILDVLARVPPNASPGAPYADWSHVLCLSTAKGSRAYAHSIADSISLPPLTSTRQFMQTATFTMNTPPVKLTIGWATTNLTNHPIDGILEAT